MEYIWAIAGFSKSGGSYHLPRASLEPPQELQLQVFPLVEMWLEQHEGFRRNRTGEWMVSETDFAAVAFLRMLQHLWVVLLQDLAVLQPDFPSLPAFKQPLFASNEWLDWSARLRAGTTATSELVPRSLLMEQAAPEIAGSLHAGLELVGSALLRVGEGQAAHQRGLADVGSALRSQERRLHRVENFLAGPLQLCPAPGNVLFSAFAGSSPSSSAAPLEPASQLLLLDAPSAPSSSPSGAILPPAPRSDAAAAATAAPSLALLMDSPPVYMWADSYTVLDLWREWTVGYLDQLSIDELERRWRPRWRPKKASFFCRRKVVIDAIRAKIAAGHNEESAVAFVEARRGTGTLNQLHQLLAAESKLR